MPGVTTAAAGGRVREQVVEPERIRSRQSHLRALAVW